MPLRLPTRNRSSAPALPAAGRAGSGAALATVPNETRAPSRYVDAGRKVFGGLARGARRAAGAVRDKGTAASSALARTGQTDTLGGVFAQMATPMIAAGVNGVIDGSDAGQRFLAWTGGWIKPSSALALVGGILRGFGWDRRFLGKHLTRANTANLKAMLPIKLYEFGFRVPGLVSSRVVSRNQLAAGGGQPEINGTEGAASSAAPKAAPPPETVPGEATAI